MTLRRPNPTMPGRRLPPGARIAVALTLALACLPVASAAQTRIFSGEHEDFSRLAIVFQQQTDWRTTRVDGGYEISFSPALGPVDLSRVFDLIPRDRIEGVRQENDGSLFIASTCDCHLDAFEAGRLTLAIDVKDGPRPDAAPQTEGRAAEPDAAAPGWLPPLLTIRATSRPTADPEMPGPARAAMQQGTPPRPWPDLDAAGGTADVTPPRSDPAGAPPPLRRTAPALDRAIKAADLESSLQDDMRRAAEAGLVDLAEDLPPAPTGQVGGGQPAPPEDALAPSSTTAPSAPPAATATGPERNIDLRTAFERRPPDDSAAADLLPCPPATRFAFLEGRSATEIVEALAPLRAGVIDEAGTLDPAAARRLVEAYLALGFGAEAASLAGHGGLAPPLARLYRSLAAILDSGQDTAPSVWASLQRCQSPAALWAFLGHEPEAGAPRTDMAALQRAFFALPSHLRLQIGPHLVERLRRRDADAAAAAIRGNLEVLRTGAAPVPPPADAPPERSGPELTAGRADQHVDDLLARTEARMRGRRMPAAEDLALAETLTREHAGTERGAKLADLVALRKLADGAIDDAAGILLSANRDADPDWDRAMSSAVSSTIVAMDDGTLLELALSGPGPELLAGLPEAEIVATADRLTGLGFPQPALAALARRDIARGSPGERALARATLAAGDPARALALVAGQDSAEAARLRGDALTALGSHALAAAAYDAAGAPERAARSAWLSGDTGTIARFGSDSQKRLAESLLADGARSPGPDDAARPIASTSPDERPSLSDARALARQSEALRESLRQLLETGPGEI